MGRDKGGTFTEKPVPPGVDPSLYCTTCETSFEDKAVTEGHLKTHRPFSCETCEKRFSQKCNLVTHMRLHTGEKPYNCDFCDKRFTQKGNLDAHIKTHTKEKPFQCVLCPKRFAFKSSMQAHIRGHQNGTGGLDIDEDDIDALKEHVKMHDFEKSNGVHENSLDNEQEEEEEMEGFSPAISPQLPHYGATIQQGSAQALTMTYQNLQIPDKLWRCYSDEKYVFCILLHGVTSLCCVTIKYQNTLKGFRMYQKSPL